MRYLSEHPSSLSGTFKAKFQSITPWLSDDLIVTLLVETFSEAISSYNEERACQLLIQNLRRETAQKLNKIFPKKLDFFEKLGVSEKTFAEQSKNFNAEERGWVFSLEETIPYQRSKQALQSLPSSLSFEQLMEELRAILKEGIAFHLSEQTMLNLLINHLPTEHIKTLTGMLPYIKDLSGSLSVDYYLLTKEINNPDAKERGWVFSPKNTKAYRLMLQTLSSLPVELSAEDLIEPLKDILTFAKDNYSEAEAHRILIQRLPDVLEQKLTRHFSSPHDFCKSFGFTGSYFKQSLRNLNEQKKFDFSKKGADQKNTQAMLPIHSGQETKHTLTHEKQGSLLCRHSSAFFEKESTLAQEETLFKALSTKKLKQGRENIIPVYRCEQPLNPDLSDQQPNLSDSIPPFNITHSPFSGVNLSFPRSPYPETIIQQSSQSLIASFNSPSYFFKAPTSDQTFHDEEDPPTHRC